jgi:hypothetical protein
MTRTRTIVLAVAVALSLPLASARSAVAGDFPNYLDPPQGGTSLGPVTLENPTIHNIFLDSNWDADNPSLSMDSINAKTQGIVDSDYFNAASQYGISDPSFSGSDEKSDVPCGVGPVPILDNFTSATLLATWLTCELAQVSPPPDATTAGGFDPPDDNSLYMVYLPQDTNFAEFFGSACGMHLGLITTTLDFVFPDIWVPAPQTVAFAVIPAKCAVSKANPLDAITTAASHEMIEAATDRLDPGTPGIPLGGPVGWIDRSQGPTDQLITGEAADLCQTGSNAGPQPTNPIRLISGILVAPYWSNVDQRCAPLFGVLNLSESGLPATVPHTATVNGSTVPLGKLGFTGNFEIGSTVSFSYPSPVSDPTPGIRWVTSDPGGTVTMSAPGMTVNDVAVYTRQFLLTTSTDPSFLALIDPTLTPSGWHDEDEVVPLDTAALIPTAPGTRYRFDHWSGDVAALTPHTSITMTAPKTGTANYVLQYLLTVQTSGLGANLTHISNSSGLLGTANDTTPLVVWIDADTGGTLTADANVNGAGGIQYFFQGFAPPPPATLTSPFTTTAVYKTMAQLIDEALASGGITGPSAQGFANALKREFDAVQHDMAAPNYAAALGGLTAFVNSVQSQCCTPSAGKEIANSLATTFQLDALLVYHNALCSAHADSEISPSRAALDYAYYANLVSNLGGTVLPPC